MAKPKRSRMPGIPENGDILAGGEKIYQALAEEFKPMLSLMNTP
ncbi:MAG: hypothetical protein ACRESQ_05415 [Gammaproteobacteria bacterium]